MRALVTGSNGFVGRWLVAHLESQGDEVTGLDAEVDVTDAAAIASAVVAAAPEVIFHLAAQASVGASWEDQAATYTVNTIGAVNVLVAAAQCSHPPRVLLVSSSEVYGRVDGSDLPITEDQPFAPVSPYAASKAAAEIAALQAWLGRGVEVVRARPFNHTGPGQRTEFVVPALARQVAEAARAGAPALYTGNLEARRDISDVRDVVRAYRALALSGEAGDAYNVCSGVAVSIRDVAERLLRIAGVDIPIVVDPERVRPVDLPELRGDPSKLRSATGWSPEVDLDETLADVLAYWKRPAAEAAGR
ncbi:MAG TPA: GDP-mannose 4,6-dehydratase [Acidimicrobiales bacterium]|nr:GDP-mannose 4,6-dehydratase [Acidimicrobiales bacterium]